jgi:hypothetical protein
VERAAGVFCCCSSYVRAALQLSDDDSLRLSRNELKLSVVLQNYRATAAERRAQRSQRIDAKLEVFIRKHGADRILSALDRLTCPSHVAAE